jgi:hypothetical protein
MDRVCVFLFELVDGCEVGFDDMVSDGVKIFWSILELMGSERYEFGSGHCRLQWHHVSSFSKIKQKKGLDSMCDVIRRMPEGLVSCDSFSPEDGVHSCQPFSFLSITYFYNHFPDVYMAAFNNPIRLRVIWRDVDVINPVLFC